MGATRKKMTFKGPSDGSLIELMPKTTGDQVYLNDETPLTPKIAEMVSAINLREKITDHIADVETLNETIDTKVADAIHNSDSKNSELKTYIDDNMAALNETMTSSHSTINSSIEAANAEISLRAKQTDVNTAISTLSNSVESKLADKANTADVETKIANLKQEILGDLPSENYDTFTEMAAYIAEHQDLTDALTEAINAKANKTDVNASLDLKANKTDMDVALAGKVNTSDLVDPGNGTISLIQGGVVKGSFTMNQSGNAEINLDNNNPTYYPMVAASATEDGKGGLVPAPAAGKQLSYLRGDGTWAVPTDTKPTLDTLGISATAAEINQLGGVTSNVQVQLNNKTSMEDVEAAIANAPKGDTGVWISQAEYDALSDEEKDSDTTYYVYDAEVNENPYTIPFASDKFESTNVGDALNEAGPAPVWLSQAEYDALSEEEKMNGREYHIYDADSAGNAYTVPFTSSLYNSTNVGDALNEVNSKLSFSNYDMEEVSFVSDYSEKLNDNDGLTLFHYKNGIVRICGLINVKQDLTVRQRIFTVPIKPIKQHWLSMINVTTGVSYTVRINTADGDAYPWGNYGTVPVGTYLIDTTY